MNRVIITIVVLLLSSSAILAQTPPRNAKIESSKNVELLEVLPNKLLNEQIYVQIRIELDANNKIDEVTFSSKSKEEKAREIYNQELILIKEKIKESSSTVIDYVNAMSGYDYELSSHTFSFNKSNNEVHYIIFKKVK